MADKTVKGETNGVNQEIIDFLDLVAKYGGKDIQIKSGKRTPSDQAEEMYNNWTGTINRGKVYEASALSATDRATMDKDWETAHDSKASKEDKEKAEKEFRELGGKVPSLHVVGKAVDLVESGLTNDMKTVLIKYMKQVPEKGCFHVQYKGKLPSDAVVKKELKAE
jgi:hypothetical protein